MQDLSREAGDIAGELTDPGATAYAWSARRSALWDPAHLADRLTASTAMLRAAREVGDLELQLQAHAWLVVDLLEKGDRDGVDAQIDAFALGAEQLRQPLFRWQTLVWRGMRALLDGSLQEAEDAATEALAMGAPEQSITAPQYHLMQLVAIRRAQGRTGELENAIREVATSNPHRPGWRAALAMIMWETGRHLETREVMDDLAQQDFQDIPPDGEWIPTVALLAQLCSLLGGRDRASTLYELLTPYAENNIVRGIGATCLGPVARLLGRLSVVLRRPEEARRHFESALRSAADLRSAPLLAYIQLDYAEMLGRGARAAGMIDEAAATAAELGLPGLAVRAQQLR
jgi:tetratricopeptide (TPR) repeat protein